MAKSSKPRNVVDVCADCNAPEPCWASVNRGVYMCNDCAGVHRSLGRHVSQVKHLHRSDWHSKQLNLVKQLVAAGANSIWEHSLLDPAQMRGGKRKPNPNDPVHPTKSEFIRAKYEQLAFIHRPPRRDGEDFGKQLHSSVRTANLDTSLRLLSLGAQANFFHPEKGNTPIHVAAKHNQSLQVELLVTYGADPAAFDSNKQNPEAIARAEGNHDLADQLVELQYELSDRMSNFVWGIKPDHKQKNHYALQKARDNGVGVDGRKRLQALSNQIFEELAMDVYDEIDRRETEKLWQESKHVGSKVASDHVAVPFLPLHPEYSPTRNQGRQKLARFTQQELAILTTDILYDIVRRQSLSGGLHNLYQNLKEINHNPADEDPIYDLPPDENLDYQSIENSAAAGRPTQPDPSVPLQEFLDLKQELFEKTEEVTRLQEQNKYLSNKVTDLAKQNHELLKQKQQSSVVQKSAFVPTDKKISASVPKTTLSPRPGNTSNITRPTSVFNPNESLGSQSSLASADNEQRRRTIHEAHHGEIVPDKNAIKPQLSPPSDQDGDKAAKKPAQVRTGSPHNSVGSDYDNNVASEEVKRKETSPTGEAFPDKTSPKTVPESFNTNESNNTATMKESAEGSVASGDVKSLEKNSEIGAKSLPKAEEISQTVTKNIHNLLQAAQKGKIENYLSCAENILTAVKEIVTLFPESPGDSDLSTIITKLLTGAEKLKTRCQNVSEQDATVNSKQVTEEIIKNAYDIVKAAKELVTMTTKLQSAMSSS